MNLLKFSLFIFVQLSAYEAVTYEFSGGRLGDNLLAYLHAKWVSYAEGVPLLYQPFKYSSELVLDEVETHLGKEESVWKIPYFPENLWEIRNTVDQNQKPWLYFAVNWEDVEFRKMARSLIQPKHCLGLVRPPADSIGVAIHFREGGGYDYPNVFKELPLKFPPMSYYVEALHRVIQLFPGRKIYCYLFTDALNTGYIANRILQSLPADTKVVLEYRKRGNHWKEHVLEDFFSLFQFDVLIRPQSNFSLVPSLLHDYMAVFSPEEFSLRNRTVFITKIEMKGSP